MLEGVAKHAVKGLPKYSVPAFLRVVTEHKTTGNNKQQKAVLRNEGIYPARMGGDRVFWLREDDMLSSKRGIGRS